MSDRCQENAKEGGLICLGIDPGTKVTGYGIIQDRGSSLEVLDYGVIRPPIRYELPKRYLVIFEALEALLAKFSPDVIAVESQFVRKNVQSSLKLGMAKGAVMIAAARKNIPIFEYPPKKAKLAATGTGNAGKMQVQRMIQMLLKLPTLPLSDASDALAMAICHLNRNKHLF